MEFFINPFIHVEALRLPKKILTHNSFQHLQDNFFVLSMNLLNKK